MCQLCAISEIANKDRWPKPVEESKVDLHFLISTIHDDHAQYQAAKQKTPATPVPEVLIGHLRMLRQLLNCLEEDREKWWTSKAKRDMRKKFELEGDQKKLSELHKINNAMASRFEEIQAKLGMFVKWSLGMNGEVHELENAWKVSGGAPA